MSEYTNSHHVSYKLNGGWGQPNSEMSAVLLLFMVAVVPAWMFAGMLGALVDALICLPLYAPVWGPEKLAGVNALQLKREQRKWKKRGGNIFTHDLSNTLLTLDEGTHSMSAPPSRSKQPATILSFQPAGRSYRMSFFRLKEGRNVDDLVAVVVYDGAPGIVNADSAIRYIKDRRIVGAFKKAVSVTDKNMSYSQFVMCRPADMLEPIRHAEARWHPDFQSPEAGSPEDEVRAQAIEEADLIYQSGNLYRIGATFRMAFPPEWKNKDLNSLTEAQVRSVDLVKVVDTFCAEMRSVTTMPRLTTLFEITELAFLLYNAVPEDLLPFFAQMHEDIAKDREGEFNKLEDAPTLKRGPFPSHLSLHHDHLLSNRTYHSHLLVTRVDGMEAEAGYLDHLFQSGMPFVYSKLTHTQDYVKGVKRAKGRRKRTALVSGLVGTGRSDDPDLELAEAEKAEEARGEHHRLFQSRSRATLSRVMVSVQEGSCEATQSNAHRMSADLLNHSCYNVQSLGADEHHQHEPLLGHLCLGREM